MSEFLQSCTTLAFSMSLLSLELMDRLISMERREFRGAANTLNAVSSATVDQLGPRLRSAFGGVNDIQRYVVGIMFDVSLDFARNAVNRLAEESGPDQLGEWHGIENRKLRPEGGDQREPRFTRAPAD